MRCPHLVNPPAAEMLPEGPLVGRARRPHTGTGRPVSSPGFRGGTVIDIPV